MNSKTAVVAELPLEIAIVKILSGKNHDVGSMKQDTPGGGATERTETPAKQIAPHEKKDLTKTATKTEVGSRQKVEGSTKNSTAVDAVIPDLTRDSVLDQKKSLFDLSHIQEHWHAILNTARELNASISLGLSTARPSEVSGNTIVIAVKYPFHKERLEEASNQLTLEKAFDTILGAKMKLVIRVDESPSSAPSENANPLINQALSMLGGRVVTEN